MSAQQISLEQMPVTVSRLASMPRPADLDRFRESLAMLNHCLAAGEVRGKSAYGDLRQDLSRVFETAYEQQVSEPFFRAGGYESQPEELQAFSWLSSGFGSVAKAMREAGKLEGKSACADAILALLREWQPLIDALNDLKGKVVSARAPAGEGKQKPVIPATPFSELVEQAIEAYKPVLIAEYKDFIPGLLSRAVEAFGAALEGIQEPYRTNDKGVRVENRWQGTFRQQLEPVVDFGADGVASISPEKLEIAAQRYADAVAESLAHKIMSKAGELDDAEIKYLDGMRFKLTGTKNGHAVMIEQSVVLKRSPLGLLFNQFPALIYVDGKFKSEFEYKTALGGAVTNKPVVHWEAVRYGVKTKACAASAQGARSGYAQTTLAPEEVTCERCRKIVEELRIRGRLAG